MASSLDDLMRRSILVVASAISPSFSCVGESEIELSEYQDFLFYLEDYAGRKVPLRGCHNQFSTILRFFSNRIVLYIYLSSGHTD
ncbi:hypothetical protein NEDG_01061 [Nematocida displodere]|uniref:Uncharacterized protein n=1 Tax=Nematocida displodere TaxID=1805483 RepID=A0A177ECN4_9MICR|nr:hypothetical protein NEDG_01061 [Nematocida displodere]